MGKIIRVGECLNCPYIIASIQGYNCRVLKRLICRQSSTLQDIPSACPLPDDPTDEYTAALVSLADQMEEVRKERDWLKARVTYLEDKYSDDLR